MKPETVRRAQSEQDSRTRTYPTHAGLVAGSIIFTAESEIPVKYLLPGNKFVTRNSGMVTMLDTFAHHTSTAAVAIKAGSLRHTRLDHDVIIPAIQHILVRHWRQQSMFVKAQTVVEAGDLIDGEFITDLGTRDLQLAHLTFDRQHVIYADGL